MCIRDSLEAVIDIEGQPRLRRKEYEGLALMRESRREAVHQAQGEAAAAVLRQGGKIVEADCVLRLVNERGRKISAAGLKRESHV